MTTQLVVPLVGVISNQSSGILNETSTSEDYVTAISNYLKANNELERTNPSFDQGQLISKEAALEIAKKYDYIGADADTGKLVILSAQLLADQGAVQISLNSNQIIFAVGPINKTTTFQNYGTINSPLAVETTASINVTDPSVGTIPVIINQSDIPDPRQLIAQTVIINAGYYQTTPFVPSTGGIGINPDLVTGRSQRIIAPGTGGSGINPDLLQEIANQDIRYDINGARDVARLPRLTTGFNEDIGSLNPEAILNAAKFDQAANAVNKDVQNIVGITSGDISSPQLNSRAATTPNNAGASNVQFTSSPQNSTVSISSNNGVNRQVTVPPSEKPNPLHDYANYTYKFTLYAISAEQANKIASGSVTPANPEAIISGGASQVIKIFSSGGSSTKTSPFDVDFYIDNLMFDTVPGNGARNRGTDFVDLNFDVIEPYTVTFLPRLFDTAGRLCKGRQDIAHLFFVLKLEFLGYNDNGDPVTIPKTTKYMPFRMLNLEFDVDNKGAVYKVKGTPIQFSALSALDNTIPFHIEISGQTLEELFNGGKQSSDGGEGGGTATVSRGLAKALDDNEEMYVKQKAKELPNTYSFRFEDGIGDKKINDPNTWTSQKFRFSNARNLAEQTPSGVQLDKDKNTFRMQAGSRITDIINNALQISEYYTQQFDINPVSNTDLFLHKIIPEIKFGEIDKRTNLYQRNITYVIIPYKGGINDTPHFGQKPPINAIKKYNWIFTGQNKDVISAKINYKMAFFDLKSATKTIQATEGQTGNTDDEIIDDGNTSGKQLGARYAVVNTVANQQHSGDKSSDVVTLSIQELFAKQFDPAGDLVSLDLQIIGDPDLVQQDYLLFGAYGDKGQLIYDSGSANFTSFDQHFQFSFKTPMTDYNETTGLFGTAIYPDNVFDGIYKIVRVKSEFRAGKFTQTLQNVRVRNQTAVTSASTTTNATRPSTNVTTPTVESATGTIDIISGATLQGSSTGTVGATEIQIGAF